MCLIRYLFEPIAMEESGYQTGARGLICLTTVTVNHIEARKLNWEIVACIERSV